MLFLSSCYKNHLYVQQEWVDANFLASSKVHTPDPRLEDPPHGQRLIIAWDFPKSLFEKDLFGVATVRFWDHRQEEIPFSIPRKRDITAFFFQDTILTYRVQIFSAFGQEEVWEHHFWTNPIEF